MFFFASALLAVCFVHASPVSIQTTSGNLQGIEQDGVISFKGVRFAQAPTGDLRWAPPVPFLSNDTQNATVLGPACLQQFQQTFGLDPAFVEFLWNNPADPPIENEDCLFLNVWASPPQNQTELKPVLFYIYGGGLHWGTASLPVYDGASIALNQDIIVVTFNYRTNIFGFPGAPDIPLEANNLGFLDQELALKWVHLNIGRFGGDKDKITIMGHSAGAESVSGLMVRHPEENPPFRAAVAFTGDVPDAAPVSPASFEPFNNVSAAVGCTQDPGPSRLACLKQVPAETIQAFTNGPTGPQFTSVVDNFTTFADNLERIRAKNTARVPFLTGNTQDDGSLITVVWTNLTLYLEANGFSDTSPDMVRALYPGQNDTDVISSFFRDFIGLCPASLWSQAYVESGISSVYRYAYGAVFADMQLFPNAGAWHSSELPEFFGTFNTSTATPAEVTLSKTFQTAIANFIKNPDASPAPNWPKYVPGNTTSTLAKLAYSGNVDIDDFVQAVQSDSMDTPCTALFNPLLDPLA